MAASIAVRLAVPVAEWFESWLSSVSARYAVLDVGDYLGLDLSQLHSAQSASALLEAERALATTKRWDFLRNTVPLYSFPTVPIDSVSVDVPDYVRFKYQNPPMAMPMVNMRPVRPGSYIVQRHLDAGLRPPRHLLQMSVPRPGLSGQPPKETNRRRQDTKVPGWYSRFLALVNRTYGPYSEFMEVVHAYQQNGTDFGALATALAINEAVDVAYGRRARWLKSNVYHSSAWPFPVGLDALSRIWR